MENSTAFQYSKQLALDENSRTYNAYAGCDIQAYMGHKKVATLQGITVSITRETLPLFCFGDPSMKTAVKGKRAITGNLVFTQFDRHAILKMAAAFKDNTTFGELWNSEKSTLAPYKTGNLNEAPKGLNSAGYDPDFAELVRQELQDTYDLVSKRVLRYADQIPPFDITVTMVNEQGAVSYTALHSVQLINEGFGYTLDDLTSEVAFTYLARMVDPLDVLIDPSNIKSNTPLK